MARKLTKKLFLLSLVLILTTNMVIAKTDETIENDGNTDADKTVENTETDKTIELSVDKAIRTGIENSIIMKQLENEIELSNLKQRAYGKMGSDLKRGEDDLDEGEDDLEDALRLLSNSQDILNKAKLDIVNGIYPQNFPNVEIVPGLLIIKSGDNIKQTITDFGHGLNVDEISNNITKNVNDALEDKQKEIDAGKNTYESSQLEVVQGMVDYSVAKATISSALSNKLDISELSELETDNQVVLLLEMAQAATKVITASKDIAKNKIALMIQNSYYETLKAKEIVDVKEAVMKRGQVQYEIASNSFECGMIAKDDLLIAKIYYTGVLLDYQKALSEYKNHIIQLKEDLNIPLDQNVQLEEEVVSDQKLVMDLEKGIELGLSKRLEIIKINEQISIYDLCSDMAKDNYGNHSVRYREVLKLKDNADLELKKSQVEIESEIRQSYNTMVMMESLLKTSKDMVEEAEKCLEIAEDKYEVGLGISSTILKQANLESLAGTQVEVINAEENLAKVEEKYIEILYGYNLSKAKYLNDIGYLRY